jgi:hypothetical protein
LALNAEKPDLTLEETLAELRKRRIRTSRSSLCVFSIDTTSRLKKTYRPPNGSEQMSHARGDVGYASKGCLIQPGWCLSMRLQSAPT